MFEMKPEAWVDANRMMKEARKNYIEGLSMTGLGKEWMGFECDRLTELLAADNDGPLDRLLIDQVMLACLRLSYGGAAL